MLLSVFGLCDSMPLLKGPNLKTRTAMEAEISVFIICIQVTIRLLLYNLPDCTIKLFLLMCCRPGMNVCNNIRQWLRKRADKCLTADIILSN